MVLICSQLRHGAEVQKSGLETVGHVDVIAKATDRTEISIGIEETGELEKAKEINEIIFIFRPFSPQLQKCASSVNK